MTPQLRNYLAAYRAHLDAKSDTPSALSRQRFFDSIKMYVDLHRIGFISAYKLEQIIGQQARAHGVEL